MPVWVRSFQLLGKESLLESLLMSIVIEVNPVLGYPSQYIDLFGDKYQFAVFNLSGPLPGPGIESGPAERWLRFQLLENGLYDELEKISFTGRISLVSRKNDPISFHHHAYPIRRVEPKHDPS